MAVASLSAPRTDLDEGALTEEDAGVAHLAGQAGQAQRVGEDRAEEGLALGASCVARKAKTCGAEDERAQPAGQLTSNCLRMRVRRPVQRVGDQPPSDIATHAVDGGMTARKLLLQARR